MAKKHTLLEHRQNVWNWWNDWYLGSYNSDHIEQQLMLIWYERWLNDRDLLTDEDGYEWKHGKPQ